MYFVYTDVACGSIVLNEYINQLVHIFLCKIMVDHIIIAYFFSQIIKRSEFEEKGKWMFSQEKVTSSTKLVIIVKARVHNNIIVLLVKGRHTCMQFGSKKALQQTLWLLPI